MARDEMPTRRPRFDDGDYPSIEKPGGRRSPLMIGLAVAAVGLVLLLCVGAIAVGIIMSARESTAVKIEGTWKCRWTVHGQQLESTYIFRRDGTFREETLDLRAGQRSAADGRWQVQDGQIQIDWHNGGFEDASVRFIDRNTIEYRIVNHNDVPQIGLVTTFRRQ